MGILDRLFKRKKKEDVKVEEKVEEEPIEINEENVINLGWYWSENKQEWQLAKIKEDDRKIHFYVVGASGTGKSKFLEFLVS
jgi:putative ribosome biogenesis GTPase RsgA